MLAPSNPVTSIGPILGVPGIRDALRTTPARVLAVSPMIAGRAVSGPAEDLMRAQDLQPSSVGIAEAYRDFLDTLLIDESDAPEASQIEQLGIRPVLAPTLMKTDGDKIDLARATLNAARLQAGNSTQRIQSKKSSHA